MEQKKKRQDCFINKWTNSQYPRFKFGICFFLVNSLSGKCDSTNIISSELRKIKAGHFAFSQRESLVPVFVAPCMCQVLLGIPTKQST